MRLVTLFFLLLLLFSVACGQTREEQIHFVDSALKRISNRIVEREASFTNQIEQIQGVEQPSITMTSAAQEKYKYRETEYKKDIARYAAKKAELNMLSEDCRTHPNDNEKLARLVEKVVAFSTELGLKSSVNITSQYSNGTHTTGARVRFQGDDERICGTVPRYSGGLTPCTESLNIGKYYFWTERSDKETSNKEYCKYIINPDEKVQLVEDR
jgi:hypothetical protein